MVNIFSEYAQLLCILPNFKDFTMAIKKNTLILTSLLLAIGLNVTACGKKEQNPLPTEDIAAEQGEIARAKNPAPDAKEPATATATASTPASIAPATPTASTPASTPAPAEKTAQKVDSKAGENLYASNCKTCHDTGLAGAPKLGDMVAWKDRVAQGNDVLYKHAIEGFQGKTGIMPAKGGSSASDEEVKSAVDYMVSKLG